MTESILLAAIVFLFAGSVAGFYYREVIRPLGIDVVQFRLFALRDKLRRLAIDGAIPADSYCYRYLEHLLNRMVHTCGWYGFGSFLEAHFATRDARVPADVVRFDRESTPNLKELERKCLMVVLLALAINSPAWLGFGAAVCFGLFCWKKAKAFVIATNRLVWHVELTSMSTATN